MDAFPHHYKVSSTAEAAGHVVLSSENLPEITTAPPREFGGPGDQWSPEALLVGAVADCFILTFRAVAKMSGLEWSNLECNVSGTLDRVEKVTRFTAINVEATLTVPAGTDIEKAEKLLHKAEHGCLITNSLIADSELTTSVNVAA